MIVWRRLSMYLAGVLLVVVALAGCSSGADTRVLFVGNRYTAGNDLSGLVRDLAASSGHDLEVAARATGGSWLRDHTSSPETLSAIADGGSDYVVLEEQNTVPAARDLADRESRPAAVKLANEAIQNGSSIVLS